MRRPFENLASRTQQDKLKRLKERWRTLQPKTSKTASPSHSLWQLPNIRKELLGLLLGALLCCGSLVKLNQVIGTDPTSDTSYSNKEYFLGRDIWVVVEVDCPFRHRVDLEADVLDADGMLLFANLLAQDHEAAWTEAAFRSKLAECKSIDFDISESPGREASELEILVTSGTSVGTDFGFDDEPPDPVRLLAETQRTKRGYSVHFNRTALLELSKRKEGGSLTMEARRFATQYSHSVRQVQLSLQTKAKGTKEPPLAKLAIGLAPHLTALGVFPEPDSKAFGMLLTSEFDFSANSRHADPSLRRAYVTYQDRFLQKSEVAKITFWSVLLGVGAAILIEALQSLANLLVRPGRREL